MEIDIIYHANTFQKKAVDTVLLSRKCTLKSNIIDTELLLNDNNLPGWYINSKPTLPGRIISKI